MTVSQNTTVNTSIPGTNIPTIRELVKTKQSKQLVPPKDRVQQRAEDLLMKWQPSASSHKGIISAVEGEHPYQNIGDAIGDSYIERCESNNHVMQEWYEENREFLIEDINNQTLKNHGQYVPEPEGLQDEDSSFVLTPMEPLTTITQFGTVTRSSHGEQRSSSLQEIFINEEHSRNNNHLERRGITLPIDRTRSCYRIYYQTPIPSNYIDAVYDTGNNTLEQNRYHTLQQPAYQNQTRLSQQEHQSSCLTYLDYTTEFIKHTAKDCFSWMTCYGSN